MITALDTDEKVDSRMEAVPCEAAQKRNKKGYIQAISWPEAQPGKLFVTNKRIIFECSQPDYNHSIIHTEVIEAEGENKGWLGPGSLMLLPFETIDTTGMPLMRGERIGYLLDKGNEISNILNQNYYKGTAEKRREKWKEKRAKKHEKLLEYDEAANIYKELGMDDDTIRVRKLKAEQGSVKVTQKVVHGDEVTKTEIKDSVLNRSNVGGGTSKAEQLREAKSLFEEGLIDDDEFKQMKKEILGK